MTRSTPEPPVHARSAIRPPLPPSAMKKPSSLSRMRMSVANAQQAYLNPKPRLSFFPSQSLNVPPSAQKAVPYGRTPLRNTVNKMQWGGGRPSTIPPTPGPSHVMKDSRNIRDKAVQQNMRNAIFVWLQESNYQGTYTRQTLQSPTARDFRGIFEHLILFLDPTYVFGKHGRKFEDEIIPILKAHHYPFADSIDKKWFAAPASMHSWYSLVAMLHWLSELCRARDSYIKSDDPTLQNFAQVGENWENPMDHLTLAFDYCNEAYGVFLSGADDFQDQDKNLEDRYSQKGENILSELEGLRQEHQVLSLELRSITEKPAPIVDLETMNSNLKKDKRKLEEFLEHKEGRKQRVIEAIQRERKSIELDIANLEKLRHEQERLSQIIKDQNLTSEEVAEMNNRQETLTRTLEELRRKYAETSNAVRTMEVALAKRTENVEQAVDEYTEFLDKLGLFPTVPHPYPPADLRLEVNFAAANPKDMLRRADNGHSVNLKYDVKEKIDLIAAHKRSEKQRLEDEVVTVEQELDDVTVETDKIDEEVLEVERRTGNLMEEAEAIRVASQQEALISKEEADRLQSEIIRARTAALKNGTGVKSRLQALQIAYQEQIELVERLKEETVRTILKSSSDIAAFKEEISILLSHVRQHAEEN